LEWEEVYAGTHYGTLRSEVDRIWAKGKNVIFDIDVEGGLNLKNNLGRKHWRCLLCHQALKYLKNV